LGEAGKTGVAVPLTKTLVAAAAAVLAVDFTAVLYAQSFAQGIGEGQQLIIQGQLVANGIGMFHPHFAEVPACKPLSHGFRSISGVWGRRSPPPRRCDRSVRGGWCGYSPPAAVAACAAGHRRSPPACRTPAAPGSGGRHWATCRAPPRA